MQQAQQNQLKQLFLLVVALGSKIELVVEVVEKSSSNKSVEPLEGARTRKEKCKTAARGITFQQRLENEEEASGIVDIAFC
jgi:hypothetical protein